MTEDKNNGFINNTLFQLVSKSSEVMTELIKTIESVEDTLKTISQHCNTEDIYIDQHKEKTKTIIKLLIANLIMGISVFIVLASGGAPGWLVELITKFIP